MVVCLFLLLFLPVPASAFVVETVDTAASAGWFTSLDIDDNDALHVSYYNGNPGVLKYAKKTGGAWTVETVDVGGVGGRTALALDDSGQPHIAYYDASTSELKHAEFSGEWVTEAIANDAEPWTLGNSPFDIDVDGEGSVHVVYQNGPFMDGKLMYAMKQGGSWSREVADSTSRDDGKSPSLIVDDDGTVHIVHLAGSFSSATLRYVRKLGGSWIIEGFDATDEDSRACDLALDKAGNPHVSYYEQSPFGDLRYVRKSGSTWSNDELVDATGNVGATNAIVVDGSDQVHISASLTGTNDLRYYRKSADTWTRQSGDTDATGQWSSIALDSSERPHISYRGPALRHVYVDVFTAVRATAPPPLHQLVAQPNPSTGSVTLRFASNTDALLRLGIFEASGRLVRSLGYRRYSAGEISVTWDGFDSSGREVAPGTYFLRLTSPSGDQATKRITVVR